MSQRDSGIIDLFAIQASAKAPVDAAPSGPLPALSVDTSDDGIDIDVDAFRDGGAKARRRTALVGFGIGALALAGVLVFSLSGPSSKTELSAANALVAAPQAAVVAPAAPPIAEAKREPVTAVAASKEEASPEAPSAKPKPDYDRASARAAHAASKKKPLVLPKKPIKTGVKLQKVQSSGVR
jgi:hypothetical protein